MRTMTRTAAAGLVAAALLLAGCGSDKDSDAADKTTTTKAETTTTAAAELELTDVWARQSPMGATIGAAYLTITSPVDDALLGASVDPSVAKEAQVHETVMADDTMSSTTMAEGGDMATTTTAMEGDMTSTTMGGDDMGNMTMREVKKIDLPAGKAVELKPGGYHIMLMELVEPLKVGDTIEITLTFEKAGEKTVTAEVREG